MMESRSATRIGGRAVTALVGFLLASCSSNPPPEPVAAKPEPTAVPTAVPLASPEVRAPGTMEEALFALRDRDYGEAHTKLIEVVELCGHSPLSQQALLLVAAAELDPRNPSPRRSLAAKSAALLLTDAATPSWARQFSELLYLLALKTGARKPSPADLEASELSSLYGGFGPTSAGGFGLYDLMDEDPSELARIKSDQGHSGEGSGHQTAQDPRLRAGSASEHCAARWPDLWDRRATDRLPSLGNSPYPAQVEALRTRVQELEEELKRIRRIVTQP